MCVTSLWERGRLQSRPSRRSRHDRRSRCHPVGVAVVVRQWRGSKHSCKLMPPHNATCRPTTAALCGRRSHVDRDTQQRMRDQGRGALFRMGGAPLIQNWSLPFILSAPPPPPPHSCHPSVQIGGGGGGGGSDGNYGKCPFASGSGDYKSSQQFIYI